MNYSIEENNSSKDMTYDDILNILNVKFLNGKLLQQKQMSESINPYFSQQSEPQNKQQVPIFHTREEYMEYMKQQEQERKRIREIKSTKLLFSNGNNTDIVIHKSNNVPNFSFRGWRRSL